MSKKTGGGDQGDFDNVYIRADFFPGLLPLPSYHVTKLPSYQITKLPSYHVPLFLCSFVPLFLCSCVVPLFLCGPFVPMFLLCPFVPLSLNECVGTKLWSKETNESRSLAHSLTRSVRTYENWKARCRPAPLWSGKNSLFQLNCQNSWTSSAILMSFEI